MSEPLGATALDWYQFDFELGLGANLLPCVPFAPDVRVLEGSSLAGKVGKIPSQFNANGEAHGLKEWNKREILPAEVAAWSRDRRLNICLRTGALSGCYALDVDVDGDKADEISAMLAQYVNLPRRIRSNSDKFLLLFRMSEPCKKRIITVVEGDKAQGIKPQRLELLADGQQAIIAGTHTSGQRYRWLGGLPTVIPVLTIEQLNTVWTALSTAFEVGTSPTPSRDTSTTSGPSETLTQISDGDWTALIQALRFMLPHAGDADVWSSLGYSLLSLRGSGRPVERLWLDFSKKAEGYEPGAAESWWDAHRDQTARSDYRHALKMARDLGWSPVSEAAVFTPVEQTDGPADDAPPPLPPKPLIQVSSNSLVDNTRQISEVIRPFVYVQGNVLVRPGDVNLDDSIRRSSDQVVFVPATKGWTRTELSSIAQFQYYKKDGWADYDAPAELVAHWMDMGGWPQLRPLDAVARAPYIRPDGSICDVSGYDSLSRCLYLPSAVFAPVPVSPTMDEARAALERLLLPFDQFPWYTDASRSAFAAHILTEAARLAIERSPMFWYTAPDAGTGKSLLSEAASTIVHGFEPAQRPWVSDGDELRKTLFASLLAGDRSIAFDNVPTGFKARAPELCAFLTSAIWKDRKLGVSETHAVPNRSVVSASGNNVTPVSDLARRSVVVRLDANSEEMSLRRFRIPDLRAYLAEHRTTLLVDALTIIRAYSLAERVDCVPLPSFESWSRICREPLLWLGLPDPCDTQKGVEVDDETQGLGGIFAKLSASFGDRFFTCVDIARVVGGVLDADGELSAMMLNNGCQEPSSPLKVGYWLRGLRDKNVGGLKLVHAGMTKLGVRWQLKSTKPVATGELI